MLYKIFRQILFVLNPETSHNIAIWCIKKFFLIPGVSRVLSFYYCINDKRLERELFGIKFKNPVGLAAGFDKNANFFNEFSSFGFGFIEVGTITPLGQLGNDKPRLFRLKQDQALINRMGFNNEGVGVIAQRLKKRHTNIVLGGNIGKNKLTPNEIASSDYKKCFEEIAPYVDYLVLNISSPNTPGLVELQNKDDLTTLLNDVQSLNKKKYNKPILIKISPDLNFSQIDQIINLVYKFDISGIIATNTSSGRNNLKTNNKTILNIGPGGLSGQPIFLRSQKVVEYIHKKTSGKIPIIAVGGISTPSDAIKMFNSGASLVQIYTAFIYQGPSFIRRINKKLLNI